MNFLPFFMYWLIGKDSGTNLDLCKNDTSGEVGICLSRQLCVSDANGTNIGKCNRGISENVCCKVTLDYSKYATRLAAVIFNNSKDPNFQANWKVDHEASSKDLRSHGYIFNNISENPEFRSNRSAFKFLDVDVLHPLNIDLVQKLIGHTPIQQNTRYFDKVLKIFLTPDKKGNNGNTILHPVYSFSHYITPFPANYLQDSVPLDFSGNFRKFVHLSKYGNHEVRHINPMQNSEKSFDFDSTNDFRKSFYLAAKLGSRQRSYIQGESIPKKNLLRCSGPNRPYTLRSDSLSDFERFLEVYRPQKGLTYKLLRSMQVESTSDQRRSIEPELKQSSHIPTWIESPRDLREAVQLHQSHDMRKPVQIVPTHNVRLPVQIDPTHNLRKIVQSDPTHDLRKPVENDPTHYQRKPVRLMESHDLRWPVVEEVDHDLRNRAHEEDIFRSSLRDTEMNEMLNSFLQNKSEDRFLDKELDQLLYEDEFLNSKCNHDYPVTTDNKSNDGSFDRRGTEMQTEYREIFNDSLKACGIQFDSSIQESAEERNSSSWPWMVSIQEFISNRFWHKCSGSLINSLWVVTAAHCMESRPKWDFLLHLGPTDPGVTKRFTERLIDKISIHPKFNNLNFDHDIALLRMNSAVVFQPDIVPVCLSGRVYQMERKMAVVLGWRLASEKRVTSSRLLEKNVPVLTNRECEIMFSETGSSESIQTSFLCAGFEDKLRESCNGDSGGPLAILDTDGRWSLGGLYSWGKTCSSPNQPEVYIRVSRYTRWIETTIACYESNMKRELRK